MRRFRNLLVIAVAAAATGCVYERQVARDDRPAEAAPPPPYELPGGRAAAAARR